MAAGVRQRHGNRCGRPARGCDCPWEAFVYSKDDERKLRKQFPTRAAAMSWRRDAGSAVARKILRAPTSRTLGDAAAEWFDGARAGTILNRSGDRYKPAAVRGYEQGWRLRLRDRLERRKLSDVSRSDLQALVHRLLEEGLSPSTIVVTMLPLRAIYKRAVALGEVAINPTIGLDMPAVRGRRERIAAPDEAADLLAALTARDRPLWATALYAGLRRGELMALRIEDVDLKAGLIHVCRGWDYREGEILTKSSKSRRVPIAAALRIHLAEHLLQLSWREGLAFGSTPADPFGGTALTKRADKAWTAAGLDRITLHECRHTYASLMIAAGVNAKALSTYMGHANISITLDRYGHLMPGNEDEAADLLDTYLERAAATR